MTLLYRVPRNGSGQAAGLLGFRKDILERKALDLPQKPNLGRRWYVCTREYSRWVAKS